MRRHRSLDWCFFSGENGDGGMYPVPDAFLSDIGRYTLEDAQVTLVFHLVQAVWIEGDQAYFFI